MAVVTVLVCLGEVASKPWQQDLRNMENAEENVQKEGLRQKERPEIEAKQKEAWR